MMSIILGYNRKKTQIDQLLRSLPKHFTSATTLYVEGANISEDVAHCLQEHSDGNEYDLIHQTIFPKSETYRCKFSTELMDRLAELSKSHAEPEMMDHMFIYAGTVPLMIWCDAFWSNIEIPCNVALETVNQFASENDLEIISQRKA